jgi:hypothetical protein
MSLRRMGSRAIRLGGLMVIVLATVLMTAGTAEARKPKTEGLSQEEIKTLKSILPHIKFVEGGVGGKPTIQFTGVNVQVVNGEGNTKTTNGEGNLVIGYDEHYETKQTGSHDLVLGAGQTFTSYGGLVAGATNTISGPFASVTGGGFNTAEGLGSQVSGGEHNTASAAVSSVSGGSSNTASEQLASVGGGFSNTASGFGSSISGGEKNTAEGFYVSIFGGKGLKAKNSYEALPACVAPGKAGELC